MGSEEMRSRAGEADERSRRGESAMVYGSIRLSHYDKEYEQQDFARQAEYTLRYIVASSLASR